MKINCPEKMLAALELCHDKKLEASRQKNCALRKIIKSIKNVCNKLPSDSEEYKALEDVMTHIEVCREEISREVYEIPAYDTLPNILLYMIKSELNSQVQAKKYEDPNMEYESTISSDFCEHSFGFSDQRVNGQISLCGGIIFHGFPDEGYTENGSVMLSPSYGWSRHT